MGSWRFGCGSVAILEKRLLFRWRAIRRILFQLQPFASVHRIIVCALQNQNAIRKAEVHRQCDDRRHKTRPQRSSKIQHITSGPDKEEGEGYAVGGALLVVLYELRDEEEDPGCERDAAEDAAERFVPG